MTTAFKTLGRGLQRSATNSLPAISVPALHHDALEFPDGRIVLLTKLMVGQEATVLQLPAQPTTATEADAQKRIAYVYVC